MNEIWQLKIQTVLHLFAYNLGYRDDANVIPSKGFCICSEVHIYFTRAHLTFIPLANAALEFLPGILPALLGLHFSLHLRWEEEC